jgi:hypothetical protein
MIFAAVIESNTTLFGVPFAIITTIYLLGFVGMRSVLASPLEYYFLVTNSSANALFLWWYLKHGRFVEFSELGLIGGGNQHPEWKLPEFLE